MGRASSRSTGCPTISEIVRSMPMTFRRDKGLDVPNVASQFTSESWPISPLATDPKGQNVPPQFLEFVLVGFQGLHNGFRVHRPSDWHGARDIQSFPGNAELAVGVHFSLGVGNEPLLGRQ